MAEKRGAHKRGRPRKKDDPEVRERLLEAIAAGNTFRDSCLHAGISEDTFQRWRQADADFAALVKKAESRAIVRNVALIQQAAQTTWQAAAWWLERRYPQEWGRKERIEHSGPAGGALTIKVVYDRRGR